MRHTRKMNIKAKIIVFILIILVMLIGCKESEKKREPVQNKEYHIIVYSSAGLYFINYTNNNWKNREGLLTCTDYGIDRILAFNTKEEAVAVARKLKTYEDCLKYNDSIVKNCNPSTILIY